MIYCPLKIAAGRVDYSCHYHDCGWWDASAGRCAIFSIARAIGALVDAQVSSTKRG